MLCQYNRPKRNRSEGLPLILALSLPLRSAPKLDGRDHALPCHRLVDVRQHRRHVVNEVAKIVENRPAVIDLDPVQQRAPASPRYPRPRQSRRGVHFFSHSFGASAQAYPSVRSSRTSDSQDVVMLAVPITMSARWRAPSRMLCKMRRESSGFGVLPARRAKSSVASFSWPASREVRSAPAVPPWRCSGHNQAGRARDQRNRGPLACADIPALRFAMLLPYGMNDLPAVRLTERVPMPVALRSNDGPESANRLKPHRQRIRALRAACETPAL